MTAKILSLHGMTPIEIFESGIENHDDIEAVSLTVLWRDGRISTGWSDIDAATLALMIATLDQKFRNENLT